MIFILSLQNYLSRSAAYIQDLTCLALLSAVVSIFICISNCRASAIMLTIASTAFTLLPPMSEDLFLASHWQPAIRATKQAIDSPHQLCLRRLTSLSRPITVTAGWLSVSTVE
jgi:hypothetical protein